MAHILSYGSLNLDLVYQVPHFVQAGETLSLSLIHIWLPDAGRPHCSDAVGHGQEQRKKGKGGQVSYESD